jgi:hypothetical protein
VVGRVGLDIPVNNAGITPDGPIETATRASFDEETNLVDHEHTLTLTGRRWLTGHR